MIGLSGRASRARPTASHKTGFVLFYINSENIRQGAVLLFSEGEEGPVSDFEMGEVSAGDVAPAEMAKMKNREWWIKKGIQSFYSLLALVGFSLSVFAEKPQGGSLAMFISGVILMMASLLLWAGELFPAPEGGMPRANSLAHRLGLREGFSDEELRAVNRYNLRIAVQAIVIVVAVLVTVEYLVVKIGLPRQTHWVNVVTFVATFAAWARRITGRRRPRPTLS